LDKLIPNTVMSSGPGKESSKRLGRSGIPDTVALR